MHVLKIPQATTSKMQEGKEVHDLYSYRSRRNKIIKKLPKLDKLYGIFLQSSRLGCLTKIDCILFNRLNRKAYPVEFKYSTKPKKLYQRQIFQLVLEAILIEEVYRYNTDAGYIKFMRGNEVTKIAITSKLKQQVLKIISEIRVIIEIEKVPTIKGLHPRLKDYGYRNIV